jgi:hypothetical protein
MATTRLANSKIVTGKAYELDTVTAPITKARKHRLVARWLMKENSKLYCQWVIEN